MYKVYETYKDMKRSIKQFNKANFKIMEEMKKEDLKYWISKLTLEEKQEIVIQEYDLFYQRNLFNKYMSDDEEKFKRELEKELNVKINSLDWKVFERSEKNECNESN